MYTGLSLHVYNGTQANASAGLVEDMVTESLSIGDIVSVLLHRLPLHRGAFYIGSGEFWSGKGLLTSLVSVSTPFTYWDLPPMDGAATAKVVIVRSIFYFQFG